MLGHGDEIEEVVQMSVQALASLPSAAAVQEAYDRVNPPSLARILRTACQSRRNSRGWRAFAAETETVEFYR